MANIRADVPYMIVDGTEVVFRSPVDCSAITGLKVYYIEASGNTAAKEFALADAHGNNVGDIDHLFAKNVVVKVILDVTNSMAFVQNADTNAYLEGRFDQCYAADAAHNLLDNSDFSNPVNQRGLTQYRGATNAIDRWITNSGACVLDIKDGYISMSHNENSASTATQSLRQKIDLSKYAGKKLTMAAKVRGDYVRLIIEDVMSSAYQAFDDWTVICLSFTVPEDAGIIMPTIQGPLNGFWDCKWAALYEGTYTVDTLPPYVPKGYAAERMECYRYLWRYGDYIALPGYKSSTAYAFVYLPVPMRITPTVTMGDSKGTDAHIYLSGTRTNDAEPSGCIMHNNVVRITLSEVNPIPNNTEFMWVSTSGGLELNAEL